MSVAQPTHQPSNQNVSARVLVVGPAWVGDTMMAQSLFKVLKQREPHVTIDVLAPVWSKPLLERMPEVCATITMPLGHGQLGLGLRLRLGRALRDNGYDQAILLPNSLKSALTPFWAKIPRRTGFVGELRWGLLNDARRLDKRRLPLMVQRFVALGLERDAPLPTELPKPALQVNAEQVVMALERHGLELPEMPVMALCPGAEYGPAKRWPVEHFGEIARAKLAAGWAIWIFGSLKDTALGRAINRFNDEACVDLTGKTDLTEAVDLMSLATVVVSNDSGLMHVAAALGSHLVALYGSSTPDFTPPLSSRADILSLNLPCSPCFKGECPLTHLQCLRDLSPDRVLASIDRALV